MTGHFPQPTLVSDQEEWNLLPGNNLKRDACPPARHGHSAVVYKDSMYVYGGMTGLEARADFWKWNFSKRHLSLGSASTYRI